MKRVALLIGSGPSSGIGLPTVCGLTDRILSGAGVVPDTAENYYLGYRSSPRHGDVARITEFLGLVRDDVSAFMESCADYEQIHYVIQQLYDNEMMDIDNPALVPYQKQLEERAKHILHAQDSLPTSNWSFHDLVGNAVRYLTCVVWHSLKYSGCTEKILDTYSPIQIISKQFPIDIFTLNHDLLLDNYLNLSGIEHCDGFGLNDGTVRFWDPKILANDSSRVRIIKLHGSISWFQFPKGDSTKDWPTRGIGIPTDGEHEHATTGSGRKLRANVPRPIILIGTFNKYGIYGRGIFAHLMAHFTHGLEKVDTLVVSGYGFSDQGINVRVFDWLYGERDRRMIVVDPNMNDLKNRARKGVSRNWDEIVTGGKIIPIEKGLAELTEDDLAGNIV